MGIPTRMFVAAAAAALTAFAAARADAEMVEVRLMSFEEVPSVSSRAIGKFKAFIDDRAGTITYQLRYFGLSGDVAQAHIHVGQRSVNGQISVFLCQTGASPDPTGLAPQCPQKGTVSGVIQSGNMTAGTVPQGIAPGEFAELVAAIRAGVAYVNVHSATFPAGEVRGQLH